MNALKLSLKVLDDPDKGNIVSYRWDFGDGESEFGETVTHSYEKAGTYRTFLTVTDNEGKSDMTTIILNNILDR